MLPNKAEHNLLHFWLKNNSWTREMKKKACGNLMELALMILEVPSVAAWTSEFKVRDYLREKLILFANVTRKQKAISKWSKIWLHCLQQQMASQLHKLKESNLLCTISRFLQSIICLKNWSLRILNNSYLFSLQLFLFCRPLPPTEGINTPSNEEISTYINVSLRKQVSNSWHTTRAECAQNSSM